MKKKRLKRGLIAAAALIALVILACLAGLAADDAEDTNDIPSSISTSSGTEAADLDQTDDNFGNAEVSGDENALDVETYEGSVDDADGDLEDELDMTDDSGATDDEDSAENAVAAAGEPDVELDGSETQIGISGAYLVFNIRKSDEQTMSSYALTLQKVGDSSDSGMTYQKEFEDLGYFDVPIPILTWQDCPDYSMTPATEYAYRFTAKIDNKEYSVDGTFITDRDDTMPVSDEPMDGVSLTIKYLNDSPFQAYDPDSELVAEITLTDPDAADAVTLSFSMNGLLIKNVENGDAFETITRNESGTYTFSGRKSGDVTSKVCRVTLKWAALNLADAEFDASLISYIKAGEEMVGDIAYWDSPKPGIPIAVPGQPEVKIGDVDGDGKVNKKDSAILSRYLAKWDGYEEQIVSMDAADVDRDGKVNKKDSAILSRYLAKWDGYDQYFE